MHRNYRVSDLDPRRLYVLPLGVGDAFTSLFFHTSFLLIAEGRVVLVDCPAPLRRMVHDAARKARLDLQVRDIDHVILTHMHGDHCNGLEEFAFYKRFVLNAPKPHVYMLPEVEKPLWEKRLSGVLEEISIPGTDVPARRKMDDYFQIHHWEEDEYQHLAEIGSELEFVIRRTKHFIPCFGMRVRLHDFSVGYSADTAYDPEHIDFLKSANLIVHETGHGSGHTPLDKLAALPHDIRSKMSLIHVPDDLNVFDCSIPVMSEGSLYEVGSGRDPKIINEVAQPT
ncbi:MBL fold metallo-hydrolase [bacterium]|nr:MBL fold metallo-hydrolase [bacterium]